MGAAAFMEMGSGKTADEAFRHIRDERAHERGHGGYTGTIAEKGNYVLLMTTPVPESIATVVADSLDRDPRIADKWGPAGAIPVVKATRTVTVELADGGYMDEVKDLAEKALIAAKKLRKGEKVQAAHLYSYSTPQSRGYGGYGGYSSAPSRARFTKGTAQVTILKADKDLARTVTIEVAMDATLGWDVREKNARAEATKVVRLKTGEKIVATRTRERVKVDAKVEVVAPKAKTVTRYIVEGDRKHGTWATGFPSQAEARAYATSLAKSGQGWNDDRVTTFDVVGVTKRETGEALVTATRTPGTAKFRVEVTILNETKAATCTADAWCFFGTASS